MLYVSRGVLWCFIACDCPPIGASPKLPLSCNVFILIKNCQHSITTSLKTENILEFNYALKQAFRELGPCIQCAECMWLSRFRLAWSSCYWWVCSYRSLPIFTITGVMFFFQFSMLHKCDTWELDGARYVICEQGCCDVLYRWVHPCCCPVSVGPRRCCFGPHSIRKVRTEHFRVYFGPECRVFLSRKLVIRVPDPQHGQAGRDRSHVICALIFL